MLTDNTHLLTDLSDNQSPLAAFRHPASYHNTCVVFTKMFDLPSVNQELPLPFWLRALSINGCSLPCSAKCFSMPNLCVMR